MSAPSLIEAMRAAVLSRDGGCMAAKLDPQSGPCYDRWGSKLDTTGCCWYDDLELDFVRLESVGPRHVLEDDHVAMCPGHHRGTGPSAGRQWATSHRRELRDYLTEQYKTR